tara:strand:- start:983 stop:1198 length:216 start_codon:yes stop_codon:yes gene_type:complete
MNLVEQHIKIKRRLKLMTTLSMVMAVAIILMLLMISKLYGDIGELWESYQEINMFLLEIIMKAHNNIGVDT